MNAEEIVQRLAQRRVEVLVADGKLKLRGGREVVHDAELLRLLKANRAALLELVAGDARPVGDAGHRVPPNLIPPRCPAITPEMLTLVRLTPDEIQRVLKTVVGGSQNVQDVYPLAPLQEGFLFHHLLEPSADPYLGSHLIEFDTHRRLRAYLAALQAVVLRHDILRTAFVWEGVPRPLQVVWRDAPFHVVDVTPESEPAQGVAAWLLENHGVATQRMDLTQAPLLRVFLARDRQTGRWLLLQVMHHLVADHTTLDMVESEILAHLAGRQSRLPAPTPFRDLVVAASSDLDQATHDRFFRELLGDFCEPVHAFGVEPQSNAPRDEASIGLNDELSARIAAQARRDGVSPAALFHLAWALALARASGQEDVVFGTVLLGRMSGGRSSERTMGMFINTLPIRIRVDARSVTAALRQTQELLTELLYHEHAPLSLAQRMSGVKAPNKLFSALLNYRHARTQPDEPADAQLGRFLAAEERTTYPLVLNVNVGARDFALSAQSAAPRAAERVLAFVVSALRQLLDALASPERPALVDLDVLPIAERQRILVEFNRADRNRPSLVVKAFEEQVALTPEAAAVRSGADELSYRELNARADALAANLRARGVRREVRVAICLERAAHSLVALLAVLKAGGAYVPIDPTHPAPRLRAILEDSSPSVVLVDRATRELFERELLPAAGTCSTIEVGERPGQATVPAIHGWEPPEPSDLAYIMYTSGSTGKPKGVMVEHGGLANILADMARRVELSSSDTVVALTTFAFDISGLELFMPLIVGACVVLADRATARDPFLLSGLLTRERVTLMQATPSTWLMLIGSGWQGSAALTKALSGGEPLSHELAEALLCRVPRLWNVYGPTETTIWSSAALVTPDGSGPPNIGRPVANTSLYVLDQRGRPAAVGVVGELCIGGMGVARGYLNRPALTQERFVADPFVDGGHMYRTGDLASFDEDGSLRCVGRNDGQIKLRGFRIELGEIESKLAEHAAIKAAAVALISPAEREPYLAAYCVLEPGLPEQHAERQEILRTYLSSVLPAYMVPAVFAMVPELPMTSNGKLDRKALVAIPAAAPSVARRDPCGAAERAIAAIWTAVLGVDRFGAQDSFFELGGTSISAVNVVSRMRAQGLEVELADLFRWTTIEELARHLGRDKSDGEQCIVVRAGTGPGLFLVHEYLGLDWYFAPLAASIGLNLPVYGLRSIPLGAPQRDSLEELAARMVRLMRSMQRTGPFRLCGWSFGGLLAYEISRQLVAAGEEIALLALLDTALRPVAAAPACPSEVLRELLQSVPTQPAAVDALLSEALEGRAFLRLWGELREAGASLPPVLRGLSDREVELFCLRIMAHLRAWQSYEPVPLPLTVDLFTAGDELELRRAPRERIASGWVELMGEAGVRVASVPGDHFSMMSPENIGALGCAISEAVTLTRGAPDAK